ncbi:hypothetical protein HB779_09270 [Phyllobacterium sp. 628]|uniref:hypothetical protein n=1 Tax=Phyllobacterium sp. 628 TaxID=2718938 RepID=UPI0016628399|nr:hypothetical protein [Phyllobacterium sp. 628]QND52075.1 hypothetical protein HB779_09270 [Phyllobacterium sp. 628]
MEQLLTGESLTKAEGYPALVYFRRGSSEKPLIVLLPGGYHLARVFYGHSEGQSQDFVAHWLGELGFSVLAISYPLDHPVFESLYPDMAVADWSRMVAAVVADVVKLQKLTGRVAYAGWSMAGRVVPTLNLASAKQGLQVEGFVSLAATPPLFVNSDVDDTFWLAPNGMREALNPPAHYRDHHRFGWIGPALDELAQINGRSILSEVDYRRDFCGNHPANLNGEVMRYRAGTLVKDIAEATEDMRSFDFGSYSLVGCVIPNSRNDLRHALSDASTWTFINHHGILWRIHRSQSQNVSDTCVSHLKKIFDAMPRLLTRTVQGNHIFFIGKFGARKTARAIAELIQEIAGIRENLSRVLDQSQPEPGA